LRHLLADGAHLVAVRGIVGEPANFLAQGHRVAPPCRRLVQCGANRLGITEPFGTHDIQRRGARIIESYVNRTSHRANVARIVLRMPYECASWDQSNRTDAGHMRGAQISVLASVLLPDALSRAVTSERPFLVSPST